MSETEIRDAEGWIIGGPATDPVPAELLQAAADKIALCPVLIQRTEAGATEDITEPLAALLESLAAVASLFGDSYNGSGLPLARAILGED
jgi:hypothetical protein